MALPISYNIRNLRIRWQVTLLSIIGIAMVVAVFVVLAAMASGFRTALRSTGRPDNAIVLQKGSTSEITSGVPRDDTELMSVDDRIARDTDGQPLVSREIALVASLPRNDGVDVNVMLRGVMPRSFNVRGPVQIVDGRRMTPGLYEIIVGTRVREKYGLEIGRSLKLQRKDWKVVGVFSADGSGFESEIWADLDVLAPAFNRVGGYQSVVMRMKDPATFPALAKSIETNPAFQVSVKREVEFYDAQAGPTATMLMALAWLVSVIMSIGAVLGAMNTMYAIVAARTREIGTLRALGFSRRSVLISFLLESVFLAGIGGLLGCLVALPANGFSASVGAAFSDLAFAFRVTPTALTIGMTFALIMGFVGGALPAIRAARLPITTALRAS